MCTFSGIKNAIALIYLKPIQGFDLRLMTFNLPDAIYQQIKHLIIWFNFLESISAPGTKDSSK